MPIKPLHQNFSFMWPESDPTLGTMYMSRYHCFSPRHLLFISDQDGSSMFLHSISLLHSEALWSIDYAKG